MSGKTWTAEQEAAMSERGTVLVSAGAGSGKTAVLVERLLRRIMADMEPVDVDRFLVVTFTKAAAQEMRARIRQTLEDRLFAEHDPLLSERLLHQINRLSGADITTLHSFCLDLIRRYFYVLELDPGFRVADEGEIELLRQDVLEVVFEQSYESGDGKFLDLVEGFGSDRGDQPLMLELLRLYDFARSQADPETWLNHVPEAYFWQDERELLMSPWGQAVRQSILDRLERVLASLKHSVALALKPDGPSAYLGTLQQEISQMSRLIELTEQGNWELMTETLRGISFGRLPARRSRGDDPSGKILAEQAKLLRDSAKKAFSPLAGELASDLVGQIRGLAQMGLLITRFVELTKSFAEAFAEAKRARNIVDFADLEHYALRLLLDQSSGVGEVLKPYYAEVLVDEYQDINAVQEKILLEVARAEENLFLVGDVKQSIYRFRMADPGLFLAKYKEFPHWKAALQREKERKSLAIDLARNFRSRQEIVAGINFLFQQIMTEKSGEIEYDVSAALQYGGSYAGNAPGFATAEGPIEVHLLDVPDPVGRQSGAAGLNGAGAAGLSESVQLKLNIETSLGESTPTEAGYGVPLPLGEVGVSRLDDRLGEARAPEPNWDSGSTGEMPDASEEEERDAISQEAFLVAQRIREMVQEAEFQVYDAQIKAYRAVRYSDIVILMRSQASSAPLYVEELSRAGIPFFAETGNGYFAAGEVETVISLLKVIDNPRQDIPLAAVLRSALAGFTGGELGKLRALLPQGDFYETLALAAWAGSLKESNSAGTEAERAGRLGQHEAQEVRSGQEVENSQVLELKNVLEGHRSAWPELLEQAAGLPLAVKEKAVRFCLRLQAWRDYAVRNSLAQLLARIYEETGYMAYCGILPGGAQRQANLQVLYDRAWKFEETHYRGLFRFLRFLERYREQGKDMGQARSMGENENVVRIMTVHASKGLEFPVAFVVGLGRAFNMMDLTGKILIHSRLGLGVPLLDLEQRVRYPSLIHQAIRYRLGQDALAEELRILYVALTRAKEKLLLYGSLAHLDRALDRWRLSGCRKGKSLPDEELRSARRFLDWIGPALARQRGNPLELKEWDQREMDDADTSSWKVVFHWGIEAEKTGPETETRPTDGLGAEKVPNLRPGAESETEAGLRTEGREAEEQGREKSEGKEWAGEPEALTLAESAGAGLDRLLDYRLSWVYPWADLASQSAKTSVSELKRSQEPFLPGVESMAQPQNRPRVRPKFLQPEKGLTAAERGIALHTAMQHVPLKEWSAALTGLENGARAVMLERLVREFGRILPERAILNEEEAASLPLRRLAGFFQSPLGRRMLETEEVRREVPFTYALPSREEGLPQLIQGVIDALLFSSGAGGRTVELVDFKTDALPDGEEADRVLAERYSLQMAYYLAAVERLLRLDVSRVTLYVFSQDREVSLSVPQLRRQAETAAQRSK